ncbi:MAG TPA: hypothetical protein VI455_12305 [Terriglobia bacterium]
MVVGAGVALLWAGAGVFEPIISWGSETQFWQVGAFDEFLRGSLQGVSLSHEGSLQLAPPTEAIFDPEETLALSLAADRAGQLYIGTGHEGKLFRVDSKGQGKLLFQAKEPEILAVAAGPDGNIYAASSPEGKIYRIAPDGSSSVFFDPKVKYVWSLVFDAQGRLYAGTGDGGVIYQIEPSGVGKVFFDSRQTHIICLALDRDGNLLAGSDPDGLIYRIDPQGKAFVLFKADFPEIHALALDSEGHIYAAALGGSGSTPTAPFFAPQAPAATEPAAVTTITVTASGEDLPSEPAAQGQQPAPQPSPQRQTVPQRNSPSFNRSLGAPFGAPSTPQGRGALIRIDPDNSAESLWSSDRESVFGLALEGGNVLFSTDNGGKIFRLSPSTDGPRLTLVTETRDSLATRLLVEGSNVYVATSNVAKLFRVGSGPVREGTYESQVKDTKFVSRWGNLSWRGQVPSGCSLKFYSRSGNSERPDPTWSNWAGPYQDPDASRITSPSARYIQWKAVFTGPGTSSPALDDVTVAYLNENLPPQIRSLDISTGGNRTGLGAVSTSSDGQRLVVSGGPSFGGGSSSGDKKVPTAVNWQADDPNGDRLIYSLYLKAADEREWHLVKDRLRETNYTLDANAVPDGEYVARLVASDEESNPRGLARRSELVSAPFWIDNTPPRVEVSEQHVAGASGEVRFRATSNLSPLRAAEVSLDGGEWRPVQADDGIIDSRSETFKVSLSDLGQGEHRLVLRVVDIAGNTGIGKAVLRSRGGPGSE